MLPVVLVAVAVLLWVQRKHISRSWAAWRAARGKREAACFKRVLVACRSNDPTATLIALMRWLDRVDTGQRSATLAGLAGTVNDQQPTHELQTL